MTTTTKNPYPRRQGFGLRVANAKRALRRLGRDCLAEIYTRGFDNCFEMFDGDAVVWALMREAVTGDEILERGIRNMGKDVWPHWLAVYEQCDGHATESAQLTLFETASSS
jgi:hypothetical protein